MHPPRRAVSGEAPDNGLLQLSRRWPIIAHCDTVIADFSLREAQSLQEMEKTMTKHDRGDAYHELRQAIGQVDAGGSDKIVRQALFLARGLQQRASELQTPQERRQQTELDRMIQNPSDKTTLMQMTDQAFRSQTAYRAVDQLIHILDVQGIPRFFSPFDRTLLAGFQSFGSYLPGVAVPLVKDKMRKETANVVLPAEPSLLGEHLRARTSEGVRMNVNFLGEALLGEKEAQRRLQQYADALALPDIEVISVKISTIYSQISTLAKEHTVAVLCDLMEQLYRSSLAHKFTRSSGEETSKFVYMDMEEYRDMELTYEAFTQTLDRPGMEQVSAGIVLQAYVPDSFSMQRRLNAWAQQRVAKGGAPITLRIVKGANMEMERVEASHAGWRQAPYTIKMHTDANYKRMLHEALSAENIAAVRVGVATHNLFEAAYALVLAADLGALDQVQFEMLEGMANHQRRALFELTENLLLYAPACAREHFINAIGYLVRRLDENTGENNFLRHTFRLEVDSDDWMMLERSFVDSVEAMDAVSAVSRRRQDRAAAPESSIPGHAGWKEFVNEPDTDFALPQNLEWVASWLSGWSNRCGEDAVEIPLAIAGADVLEEREKRDSLDPSRPGVVVARYQLATVEDMERAVQAAKLDESDWRGRSAASRCQTLKAAAQEMRRSRSDLMGAALADGGKTLLESDPEISEAIDFLEFYGRTAEYFEQLEGVEARAKGVVVVVSPWNFPIAIPCGGVASALAAGNTVILKPASDTVLSAYIMCEAMWRAGVPRAALQFLPCPGGTVGSKLVAHEDVDVVVFTGGTETALTMLRNKPSMRLLAETGGKNATIVTGLADRDQAIKHLLHSAFSHSGQKCSATSLLILEDEIYHDQAFREMLCDAVTSLPIGSAWELENKMGPLIQPPSGDLARGMAELQEGESWLVEPKQNAENPHLVSPGVKWDVAAGSFTHMTELFGPVLAVMRANDLEHAIELANQSGYGLTSGLESLDDREQTLWLESIRAGNLYVNRSTTGAIVLRQPFGGMGKSVFGPGVKAGGPNYTALLSSFSDTPTTADAPTLDDLQSVSDIDLRELIVRIGDGRLVDENTERRLRTALQSYDFWMGEEFGRRHDHFRLVGQDNFRRYLPIHQLRVRVSEEDQAFDILARVFAGKIVGCRVTVSSPPENQPEIVGQLDRWTDSWGAAIEFVEETDDELAALVANHQTDRLRYSREGLAPEIVRRAANEIGVFIAEAPVLAAGRLELLWCVEEQSQCVDYHRYGNLGKRGSEQRAEPR